MFQKISILIHLVYKDTLKGIKIIYIAYSALSGFRSQQAQYHKTTRAQAQNNFLEL
jgi:hypothetical protein